MVTSVNPLRNYIIFVIVVVVFVVVTNLYNEFEGKENNANQKGIERRSRNGASEM